MLNFFKNKPIITIRHDKEVTGEENVEFLEAIGKNAGIPVYKGQVKHLYESDFTGYKDKCPRCQAALTLMYSNFAYATQEKSRILAAPAGLFCQSCPTVIIDDDMMRLQIDHARFQYRGVFSVESGYDDLNLLETFNGVTPTFVLDESRQNVEGIFQSVHQPKDGIFYDPKTGKFLGAGDNKSMQTARTNALRKQKSKSKSKSKMAKQSKKANRKK
ncbi:MAG: hypothetical protein LH618_14025 [Saprospiraceae bacterium]|nr:hypothetical protein [Saprospiraceae bacterium]